MVNVKIHGGIGNQMFQYAFGRALSLKNRDDLRVDPSTLFDVLRHRQIAPRNYALSTVFQIEPKLNWPARFERTVKLPYLSKAFNKYYPKLFASLGAWRYIKEKRDYVFDPEAYAATGNVYLDGYWQTEKYFKAYEKEIRGDFSFRAPLQGGTGKIAEAIRASNSVCLNVRRQEIVRNQTLRAMYEVVSPEYYRNAISIMKERAGDDAMFFVISDEIEWCRKNLKIDGKHQFIGSEHYGVEFRDALHLMSLCKHFIIPNSSFAWWGAWLSENEKKTVIAPKQWNNIPDAHMGDLLPDPWIKL